MVELQPIEALEALTKLNPRRILDELESKTLRTAIKDHVQFLASHRPGRRVYVESKFKEFELKKWYDLDEVIQDRFHLIILGWYSDLDDDFILKFKSVKNGLIVVDKPFMVNDEDAEYFSNAYNELENFKFFLNTLGSWRMLFEPGHSPLSFNRLAFDWDLHNLELYYIENYDSADQIHLPNLKELGMSFTNNDIINGFTSQTLENLENFEITPTNPLTIKDINFKNLKDAYFRNSSLVNLKFPALEKFKLSWSKGDILIKNIAFTELKEFNLKLSEGASLPKITTVEFPKLEKLKVERYGDKIPDELELDFLSNFKNVSHWVLSNSSNLLQVQEVSSNIKTLSIICMSEDENRFFKDIDMTLLEKLSIGPGHDPVIIPKFHSIPKLKDLEVNFSLTTEDEETGYLQRCADEFPDIEALSLYQIPMFGNDFRIDKLLLFKNLRKLELQEPLEDRAFNVDLKLDELICRFPFDIPEVFKFNVSELKKLTLSFDGDYEYLEEDSLRPGYLALISETNVQEISIHKLKALNLDKRMTGNLKKVTTTPQTSLEELTAWSMPVIEEIDYYSLDVPLPGVKIPPITGDTEMPQDVKINRHFTEDEKTQ